MFLYSAESSPLDRSNRFTLFAPPWQTCSFRHQFGFSGKHSSHAAITRNDYSLTFPPLSIARYSFIHLTIIIRLKISSYALEWKLHLYIMNASAEHKEQLSVI